MGNGDGDGDPEVPTFDITLSDVTPRQLAMIHGGLGQMALQALQAESQSVLEACGRTTEQLLVENVDANRYLLLESDESDFLRIANMREETLDQLGVEYVDGEVVDQLDDDAVDIEVE